MRGIHTKPNRGESVEWLTPPELIRSLGAFDLDPCAPVNRPWDTAEKHLTIEDDGLSHPWHGRCFVNPPYGHGVIKEWMRRMADHGNGIALVPSRTEVEDWFWPFLWERADAIFFIRGRLFFRKPDGSRSGNAGHGSVLAAYGERNIEAIKKSGIVGRLVIRP